MFWFVRACAWRASVCERRVENLLYDFPAIERFCQTAVAPAIQHLLADMDEFDLIFGTSLPSLEGHDQQTLQHANDGTLAHIQDLLLLHCARSPSIEALRNVQPLPARHHPPCVCITRIRRATKSGQRCSLQAYAVKRRALCNACTYAPQIAA